MENCIELHNVKFNNVFTDQCRSCLYLRIWISLVCLHCGVSWVSRMLLLFKQAQEDPPSDRSPGEPPAESSTQAGSTKQSSETDEAGNVSQSHNLEDASAGETAEPTTEPKAEVKR